MGSFVFTGERPRSPTGYKFVPISPDLAKRDCKKNIELPGDLYLFYNYIISKTDNLYQFTCWQLMLSN